MQKVKRKYSAFIDSLPKDQVKKVFDFTNDWKLHIAVDRVDSRLLLDDMKNAVVVLYKKGFSIDQILNLVDSSNLGGFYAHEAHVWYPLDDAAKIYPLSMKYGQMPMFRLSCSLKEDVIPQILQLALDFTIKRFPSFSTIVRKGFFWHYLDSVKKRFAVVEEKGAPCQPLKINAAGAQSFRVLYFKNRISVEFFHVLTDGTGGMTFLKTLVGEYFRLLGKTFSYCDCVLDPNQSASILETANEFERLCPKTKNQGGFVGKTALQMSGKLSKKNPVRIVQFEFETDKLKDLAHKYNSTVSTLVLALMFMANKSATEAVKGTIQMQLPVNMRKFYQSETLRNFSMYSSIDIPMEDVKNIGDLTKEIKSQIDEKTTLEEMSVMMTTAHKLVTSLKLIPLLIKLPAAKVIYGYLGDNRFSNTLSNLGQITMPDELSSEIESFEFILGTCQVSRASCTLCSYKNKTVFSISKSTTDPSFEEAFNRFVTELGLKTKIKGSPIYD